MRSVGENRRRVRLADRDFATVIPQNRANRRAGQWNFPGLSLCRANIFYAVPGWLVGAGVEYAFTQNWTANLEYDFLGLNNASYTIAVPGVGGDTFSTRNRDVQMLTVEVNYLFDWGGSPVAARYCSATLQNFYFRD